MVKAQSSRSMVDMDASWQKFLLHKVNSFIKWDLVRFFHDNPHTVDTVESIATVVGRDAKTIRQELDGLVKAEVLVKKVVSGQSVYRLSNDSDTRELIREFVAACHDREFRMQAINHMMHHHGADDQSRL
ncbi:MAG: hypothetical protein ACFE0Q_03110 [Anaerolineae bacterium]